MLAYLLKYDTTHGTDDRYIHNATFVGDNTMYALFHNGGYNNYEYWRLTRDGDSWKAKEVGATKGRFVSNSPVQGFATMVATSTSALTTTSLRLAKMVLLRSTTSSTLEEKLKVCQLPVQTSTFNLHNVPN